MSAQCGIFFNGLYLPIANRHGDQLRCAIAAAGRFCDRPCIAHPRCNNNRYGYFAYVGYSNATYTFRLSDRSKTRLDSDDGGALTMPQPVVGRVPATMSLPSNATSIRADITDTFSCDGKIYGYYADVDNDCQIFHICLPVTYADGKENMFRWSFVCPDETIFSQVSVWHRTVVLASIFGLILLC